MQISIHLLAVTMLIVGAAGCGGRVASTVPEQRASDAALTCDHLFGELKVNQAMIAELAGERQTANDHNAGKIAGAVLVPSYILFLDLSDTEKKEADALLARNREVNRLMETKACTDGSAGRVAEAGKSEPPVGESPSGTAFVDSAH